MGHDGNRGRDASGSVSVSATRARIFWPRIHVFRSFCPATMFIFLPLLSLLALPVIALSSQDRTHQRLVELAEKNNGIIKLDDKTYDLITSPKRDWSASIHFTALDKKRRCGPCR
jgi:hypothetical protein